MERSAEPAGGTAPGEPVKETVTYRGMTRRRLILLLVIGSLTLNLVLDGAIGLALRQSRIQYEQNAQINVTNLSRVLEQNVFTLVREIDLTLQTVADEVTRVGAVTRPSNASFASFLRAHASRISNIRLRVVDPRGNVTYATSDPADNVNVADREHFLHARGSSDARMAIYGPIKGRVSHKNILIFARRISKPDGSFGGQVHASVEVDHIVRMFSALNMGPHGVVSMWNKTTTLARYPQMVKDKSAIGSRKPSPELKALLDAEVRETHYYATAPTDNVRKSYFIRKCGEFPLWVIAGMAENDYLAPWLKEVREMTLIALLFACITVICDWQIYRFWRAGKLIREGEEERLHLELQLLHSQKLESLGVLAGGIAHDFNNILAAVLGNLELGLMKVGRDAPVSVNLNRAITACNRAVELTRQMLAYAGKEFCRNEHIDLNEVVVQNMELLQAAVLKRVAFATNLAKNLPPVMADPGQLQQVVMNLITNASEAIDEGSGTIILTTRLQRCDSVLLGRSRLAEKAPPGLYVCLEVADSGCGMDEETLHRVFDPFFTTKFTGRGLGMSAVLGIVRSHKGAIMTESDPGLGSTFRVYLPASKEAPKEPRQDSPARPVAITGTVLVVDDEPSVLEIGVEYCRSLGGDVLSASDGVEALELFRRHVDEISLVILDLSMPRMDGVTTFAELKRIRPGVKIIVISGYDLHKMELDFQDGKPDGVIQKPFSVDKLRKTIGLVI